MKEEGYYYNYGIHSSCSNKKEEIASEEIKPGKYLIISAFYEDQREINGNRERFYRPVIYVSRIEGDENTAIRGALAIFRGEYNWLKIYVASIENDGTTELKEKTEEYIQSH